MSADILIPHPYRPMVDPPKNHSDRMCAECFALPTDPTFDEHHAIAAETRIPRTDPDPSPTPGIPVDGASLPATDDLPPGAVVDDDLEGLAAELETEYAAAVAAAAVSTAVDRIARQAGRCAEWRDDYALREPLKPWSQFASDFNRDAQVYAFAACFAADAGLCDIHTALDHDAAAEDLATARPTAAQYAARVRAAVDANR